MSGAFLLFRLSLKRVRMLLCVTGLLLAEFQMLRVRIAASHDVGDYQQIAALLPSSVRAILGPSLTSVLSFNGIVCGGYFDLGNVIALVVLTIIWRCCCCAGAALPWPSAPLTAPASRAQPRPCSPSRLCSWTMLKSCGRRSSGSGGYRHFGISPRSNWSWATHCP